jgi:hypothetical protein
MIIDFLNNVLTFPWWVVSNVFIYAFGVAVYYCLYVWFRVYVYDEFELETSILADVRNWYKRRSFRIGKNSHETHKSEDDEYDDYRGI